MKITKKNIFVLLTATLTILSCSSKQVVPKYYVLEPVREIQTVLNEKIPVDVVIKSFYVPGIYNQKRIAYRSDSNELQYYYYHMWAAKPSLAVRYFIKVYLENANLFKACLINSYNADAKYYITGSIDKIERVKREDKELISLKMSIKLLKSDNDKLIAVHDFSKEETIDEGVSMNVFAQELSKILTLEMNIFLQEIEKSIKQQEG